MKYGIAGSGNAIARIVTDGLADIMSSDDTAEFLIHARRNPQGAVSSVYDFLADNECAFYAYHRVDDNPPKMLLQLAKNESTVEDPLKAILSNLKEVSGTLLLLWDEKNPESSEKIALMASEYGIQIKDLTNGLTPIIVEDDEAPRDTVVHGDTPGDSLTPFTKDELMNMNYGVLRRQAKAQGFEEIPNTKEGIVALLLGEPAPLEREPHSGDTHPMIVWVKDGTLVSKAVNYEEVKHLLS